MTHYDFKDGDTVTGRFTGSTYTRKVGIWSNGHGTTESDAGVKLGLANPTHGHYMSYEKGPNHVIDTRILKARDLRPGDSFVVTVSRVDIYSSRANIFLSDDDLTHMLTDVDDEFEVTRVETFGPGTVVRRKSNGNYYTVQEGNKYFDHKTYLMVDSEDYMFTSEDYDRVE